MTATLFVDSIGPLATVQDMGRDGLIALGLSRGGAMDRLALIEAAALLDLRHPVPGIEMAGRGGAFRASAPLRFALTGAPMQASIDGRAIAWGASHLLSPGQVLHIGGALAGTWGYLVPAAPILGPVWRGSVATHLAAGIGRALAPGDAIPLGTAAEAPGLTLPPDDRFNGGTLRLMPGPQTHLFDAQTIARFAATPFARSPQASRQGVRLDHDGADFGIATKGLISDFAVPGDVQMTGTGVPYVLMAEGQTIGGYPRIGTILAADLPRAAQAPLGATLRFVFVSTDEADRLYTTPEAQLATRRSQCRPLIRHPADVPDLLTQQLISGVATAKECP